MSDPGPPGWDRRDSIALASIVAAALALRFVYLHQIGSLPFLEFPLVDARSYHEWGIAIARGDWLGDRVFYQAPAYPYFLGALYSVLGPSLDVARVVQGVLGAASCGLLYVATRALFGRRSAIAAGVMLACYAPALFFDGMIQKTSLGLFLTSGLLVLLTRFAVRPSWGSMAAAGAVAGLLALTRENALIFAAAIPVWLLWRRRERALPQRLVFVTSFALGLAVVLLPVGFRNLAVGDTFVITTSQAGPNFYIGNNPAATGLYAPLLPGRHTPDFEAGDAKRAAEWEMKQELSPDEVSRYWLGRSFDWIARDPGAWLELLGRKTLFTLNDFEIPDTEDIYVHAEFSWLLAGLHKLLRFGVLLPLSLVGLLFAWRERSPGGAAELVAALAFGFAMTVAAFYVWSRYRFPLVPLLVPFAGLGVVRSFEMAALGQWRRLALPAALLVAGSLVSNLVLFDRAVMSQTAWVNLANIMIREQRFEDAEGYLERATGILERATGIAHESAELHFHYSALRFQQRRFDDAERHLRQMLEIEPNDFRGHRLLAQLLRGQGKKEEASHHLRESVRLEPDRIRRGRPGAPLPERRSPEGQSMPGLEASP